MQRVQNKSLFKYTITLSRSAQRKTLVETLNFHLIMSLSIFITLTHTQHAILFYFSSCVYFFFYNQCFESSSEN